MTNNSCDSNAVQITKLFLRFLEKHMTITKLLFVRIGQALVIFSIGLAFAVAYHFLKTNGLN